MHRRDESFGSISGGRVRGTPLPGDKAMVRPRSALDTPLPAEREVETWLMSARIIRPVCGDLEHIGHLMERCIEDKWTVEDVALKGVVLGGRLAAGRLGVALSPGTGCRPP